MAWVGAGTAVWATAPRWSWLAGVMLIAGTIGVWRACSSDPRRWLRGAAAERSTADLLDSLDRRCWIVRHDLMVPGSRANIDHLAIGPSGVWVVDTKTTRAAVRVGFRRVYFGDRKLDAGPVRWEASVVEDRLGVAVRPVLAVHSAGMRARGGRAGGVKVVRADRLVARLRRGGHRLRPDQVRELAEVSARFFPSFEKRGTSRVSARR
jgi:hypothetical protein